MILQPIARTSWTPSQRRGTIKCIQDRTFWTLRAYDRAGALAWAGTFEDRDDVEAFMSALVTNKLRTQRRLWNLCWPSWSPMLARDLIYDLKCRTFFTAKPNELQTWIVPKDWTPLTALHPLYVEGEYLFWTPSGSGANHYFTSGTSETVPVNWGNVSNSIETIGGGGGGAVRRTNAVTIVATGGGGGGYSLASNSTLTPNASVTYQVGAGATAVATSTNVTVNGNSGTDTWFNGASLAASTCGAKAGVGGTAGTGAGLDITGGAGGDAASGIGGTKYSGGRGGRGVTPSSPNTIATGGGGAAGPNGAGANGGDQTGGNGPTAGGTGGNGSGGAGGPSPGNAANGNSGGNGADLSASYGSGGGGSGAMRNTGTPATYTAGSGGNYGGGGGGCGSGSNSGTQTGGAGIQGVIEVAYTPLIMVGSNLAMMGM